MDLDAAREYLRTHHHAVLIARRSDGSPQPSPVTVGVDSSGRAVVSSRESAYKVRNLQRDPRVTLCAFPDGFFGQWIVIDGRATVVSLPEAMEELVAYYRQVSGEHPDWDEYRAAMERERRVVVRIDIERAGPDVSG